jgi:5'-nucleotidase (lipoprotein e(P4) family)
MRKENMMKEVKSAMTALLLILSIAITATGVAKEIKLSNDIAWVKASDAYKCCVQQAYSNAMNRLQELAKGEKPGTWCAVLDADETIISNVQFQAELQASEKNYSSSAWNEWCLREDATALPGAGEFCSLVKELGGKVIIITNRKNPPLKEATEKNITALGIPYDVCLLREGPYQWDRSKEMRRKDVERGDVKTLPEGMKLAPLKILMRVGDQTHDLYNSKKLSFKDVRDRFATDLVIIANPMYGGWSSPGVYMKSPDAPQEQSEKQTGTITWQEAMNKIGQEVVVEGKIVNVYLPDYGPAKLNFGIPWWKSLTVVIFKREKFGDLKTNYDGKVVRVSGKVATYTDRQGRKSVQIKIDDPSQIQVVK